MPSIYQYIMGAYLIINNLSDKAIVVFGHILTLPYLNIFLTRDLFLYVRPKWYNRITRLINSMTLPINVMGRNIFH